MKVYGPSREVAALEFTMKGSSRLGSSSGTRIRDFAEVQGSRRNCASRSTRSTLPAARPWLYDAFPPRRHRTSFASGGVKRVAVCSQVTPVPGSLVSGLTDFALPGRGALSDPHEPIMHDGHFDRCLSNRSRSRGFLRNGVLKEGIGRQVKGALLMGSAITPPPP